MIVEHDFLMWIKNKQNVDRFLIFARSLLIEYFIFHLSYGWYAKQCLKGLENKKHLN